MNELTVPPHGTARNDLRRPNYERRPSSKLNDHCILITSLGHEVRTPDQAFAFIGYCSVQLLY